MSDPIFAFGMLLEMYKKYVDTPLQIFSDNYTAYFLLIHETMTLGGAVLILILDMIKPNRNSLRAPIICLVACSISLAFVFYTNYLTSRYFNPALGQYWGGLETIDPFSLFLKSVAFIGVIFSILMSIRTRIAHKYTGEYYAMLMFAATAMTFVVSSSDILAIWILTEFVSMPSYILVGFNKHEPRSVEAGLKYLLIGGLSSAFMLYGFSVLYGVTGTTNLYIMKTTLVQQAQQHTNPLFIIGSGMFLAGIGFKLAMAPFHMWAPDVYEGAPMPIANFIAVTNKVGVMAVLLRVFLLGLANVASVWVPIMIGCSVLSMFIGNLFAIRQNNIKRFLAYSGITQMGFILMGLCAAGVVSRVDPNGAISSLGYNALLNYITIYAIMMVGAFLIANIVEYHTGSEDIRAYKGLFQRAPAASLTLAIVFLSLAGIPPLAGFNAKLYVFAAAIDKNLWFLVIFGALMAVMASFYYLRWIRVMFLEEADDKSLILPGALHRWVMAVPFIVLLMANIPIPFIGTTIGEYIYDYAAGSFFLTVNVYFGT